MSHADVIAHENHDAHLKRQQEIPLQAQTHELLQRLTMAQEVALPYHTHSQGTEAGLGNTASHIRWNRTAHPSPEPGDGGGDDGA